MKLLAEDDGRQSIDDIMGGGTRQVLMQHRLLKTVEYELIILTKATDSYGWNYEQKELFSM
jgi:hypothetical protein